MSRIRKDTLKGRVRGATRTSTRKAGEAPRPEHERVVLRIDATDKRGDVADVRLELDRDMVRDLILRSFTSRTVETMLSDRDRARVRGTYETEFPNG